MFAQQPSIEPTELQLKDFLRGAASLTAGQMIGTAMVIKHPDGWNADVALTKIDAHLSQNLKAFVQAAQQRGFDPVVAVKDPQDRTVLIAAVADYTLAAIEIPMKESSAVFEQIDREFSDVERLLRERGQSQPAGQDQGPAPQTDDCSCRFNG